jgi:hypothetical protein
MCASRATHIDADVHMRRPHGGDDALGKLTPPTAEIDKPHVGQYRNSTRRLETKLRLLRRGYSV